MNISGKYKLEISDKDIGREKVRSNPIPSKLMRDKNLEKTICVSVTGSVNITSKVLDLFSSEIILIEKAGIKITKNHDVSAKNDFMEADPITKRSLTKKKLAKTANKVIIM